MVRLPLKSSSNLLGSSRQRAFRCLQGQFRKFEGNQEYCQLYKDFLTEYEQLKHMKKAPSDISHPRYYLPHHGILKPDSSSTKLRVVFNGSSPTSTGLSLNDIMHTGAKLQLDVIDVLFWVRRFKFVFSTDITKMYREIMVHPDDWDLQCILWRNSEDEIATYHLTTVTYGTKAAPFLAIRVLLQLIEDEGHKYPLAIPPLTKGRYVDDIYGGSDTKEELSEIAIDLKNLCMAGGLPLAKWQSNSPSTLKMVTEEEMIPSPISFDDCPTSTKLLGLLWYPQEDYFSFKINSSSSGSVVTKRTMLSHIAQLFDPLGLVSPVTIKAKMLLQELWLQKLSWDEPLSPQLTERWCNIREEGRHPRKYYHRTSRLL
ncbi:uncharacterized protein LOC123317501 [Coccinella septempunctata]|uniref:uncharacterized protein LOC123316426 n=1 Tax=Coccinella septempunctata TaxID=41139 RepID=UPI001D0608BF|nr:uncharacterized protein LOC123316426 [Coccinella septempunctata]XP_044759961.1 uncharacterized protein LOC123317471 [Coccinella septempunctata]XP_044760007.1 uncharacterized protein LOC123317501 [Coccinella septempunctata]